MLKRSRKRPNYTTAQPKPRGRDDGKQFGPIPQMNSVTNSLRLSIKLKDSIEWRLTVRQKIMLTMSV